MSSHPRRRSPSPARFIGAPISKARYVALSLVGFAALTGSWAAVYALKLFPPILLPSPWQVVSALWESFARGELAADIWASVWRVMAGFLAGAALAIPAGLLTGSMRSAEAILQPVTEFMRYMPVPAFVPLCILWFGIGDVEKAVVIFLGTFFQLVVLVADDSRAVPNQLLETGYTLGFGPWESLWRIVLPGALPRIFQDLRVSFGWAWSYVVVAEIVAANRGVGFRILESQRYLRTADVMGGVLIIGLLGLGADWGFRSTAAVLFPYEDPPA